ncbi:MAG: hypothetical protein ACI4RA_06850, partial [Kiritimatiellia bacterium]
MAIDGEYAWEVSVPNLNLVPSKYFKIGSCYGGAASVGLEVGKLGVSDWRVYYPTLGAAMNVPTEAELMTIFNGARTKTAYPVRFPKVNGLILQAVKANWSDLYWPDGKPTADSRVNLVVADGASIVMDSSAAYKSLTLTSAGAANVTFLLPKSYCDSLPTEPGKAVEIPVDVLSSVPSLSENVTYSLGVEDDGTGKTANYKFEKSADGKRVIATLQKVTYTGTATAPGPVSWSKINWEPSQPPAGAEVNLALSGNVEIVMDDETAIGSLTLSAASGATNPKATFLKP